jgi:hypothetical protein
MASRNTRDASEDDERKSSRRRSVPKLKDIDAFKVWQAKFMSYLTAEKLVYLLNEDPPVLPSGGIALSAPAIAAATLLFDQQVIAHQAQIGARNAALAQNDPDLIIPVVDLPRPVQPITTRFETDEELAKRFTKWHEDNEAIWHMLIANAEGEAFHVMMSVEDKRDGRDALRQLINTYGDKGTASLYGRLQEFLRMSQTAKITTQKHCTAFKEIVLILTDLGAKFDQALICVADFSEFARSGEAQDLRGDSVDKG